MVSWGAMLGWGSQIKSQGDWEIHVSPSKAESHRHRRGRINRQTKVEIHASVILCLGAVTSGSSGTVGCMRILARQDCISSRVALTHGILRFLV